MKAKHPRSRQIKLRSGGYDVIFHCDWWQKRRATAYDTWLEMKPAPALAKGSPVIRTLPQLLRSDDVDHLVEVFRRYLRRLDDEEAFFDTTMDFTYLLETSNGVYDANCDEGHFTLELFGLVGKNPDGPGWVKAGITTTVDIHDARAFVDELNELSFEPGPQ